MNHTPTPPIQLDIISDVICPWCYIGKRNLDKVLQSLSETGTHRVNIMWRPFQLDPQTPPEGYDRAKQMQRKFGADGGRKIYQNILAASEGCNINFAFDKITRTPNTLNAHRLIRWAASTGAQHQVVESLFASYFEQGKDISDKDILLDIARDNMMDVALVQQLLASDVDIAQTQNDDAAARDLGVSGVPAFLVGGKMLLMGAQDPAYLLKFLTRAQEKLLAQTVANSTS